MNRILNLLVAAAFLMSAAACSSAKPPAVAAVKSRNMLAVLRGLDESYEKKDLPNFMAQVAPLYKGREPLATSLAAVFNRFDTVALNIQYTRMLITIEEKGLIRATFNWEGAWSKAGGDMQKDGGRVTLVFEPAEFKLLAVEGKTPFVPTENKGKQ